ncbi:uncharacterized protein ATNIH1004_003640 [Aspergillus tanneri]|uniref:Uncharacterized protein n=1 Tax=Aspergillus tanneri TaxID=1220188 RepID=A0A5M9N023_9EURO|nr:uncharacterized protein ATNIH1004_003640 [Aspergillus tanneri]KAA8650950.1 hypothetical protein ATNIH1004_003640 [Aspergillus tanneri]
MENPQNHCLLEYARFFGIANNFTAVDPQSYIDESCEIPIPELKHSVVDRQFQGIQHSPEQNIFKEKLNIRKGGVRFLSSIIQAEKGEIKWDDCLPDFDHVDNLRLETPILSAVHDTDMLLSRSPLIYSESDIDLQPLEVSTEDKPQSHFLSNSNQAMEEIKAEKLSCTKDSLVLIQNAAQCSPPSAYELEELFSSETRLGQDDLIFPEPPPLILSSVHDTYRRSPSSDAKSQMLPSPVSPESFMRFEKPHLSPR